MHSREELKRLVCCRVYWCLLPYAPSHWDKIMLVFYDVNVFILVKRVPVELLFIIFMDGTVLYVTTILNPYLRCLRKSGARLLNYFFKLGISPAGQ